MREMQKKARERNLAQGIFEMGQNIRKKKIDKLINN
jgi:hypothetical protein